eukprot:CAMPEP_0202919898 /NCGR_PEP_ID=MMETSP1392-20130828/76571_1 /ASSEMBLY_ACC=CAM_ASM_000868 /TAXON_ID=225041 /ORGANISM="Chlamydomonas chlamydogama, Strain SAG 11-48b" /LENGTH=84 /DNA_ID=CAMNT_0049613359 /DNA_START=467 /DNA_END=721 /DNA_ORIENTATION=-
MQHTVQGALLISQGLATTVHAKPEHSNASCSLHVSMMCGLPHAAPSKHDGTTLWQHHRKHLMIAWSMLVRMNPVPFAGFPPACM